MKTLNNLIDHYPFFQIAISIALLLAYLIIRKLFFKIVVARARSHGFEETRLIYVKKATRVVLFIGLLIVIGIIWQISFHGLSVYLASLITIVGVGLFANWSMVSNITASVILFFFFPIKIGSRVKIVDGDNSTEGVIESISLFSIRIRNSNDQDVYVPNNLVIQKTIIHLKDD